MYHPCPYAHTLIDSNRLQYDRTRSGRRCSIEGEPIGHQNRTCSACLRIPKRRHRYCSVDDLQRTSRFRSAILQGIHKFVSLATPCTRGVAGQHGIIHIRWQLFVRDGNCFITEDMQLLLLA